MPSADYLGFSDEDVDALIAWFRAAPPVDRELPPKQIGPLGRVLVVAGLLDPLAAEHIDHAAIRPAAPPEGATAEYGAYLAAMCAGCHGRDFAGGLIAGPPGSPVSPNLTPHESGIGNWTHAEFERALQYGQRPDGRIMQNEVMPWSVTASMTDEERMALWLFFRSVPPVNSG
jgi:mono/diheme cytochrome c family protein